MLAAWPARITAWGVLALLGGGEVTELGVNSIQMGQQRAERYQKHCSQFEHLNTFDCSRLNNSCMHMLLCDMRGLIHGHSKCQVDLTSEGAHVLCFIGYDLKQFFHDRDVTDLSCRTIPPVRTCKLQRHRRSLSHACRTTRCEHSGVAILAVR
jgi:hypothetical protein